MTVGPVKLLWPDLMSFDWRAATIAVVAALLVFRFKRGMLTVLGASALMGLGLTLV
jgi:chromate transporter